MSLQLAFLISATLILIGLSYLVLRNSRKKLIIFLFLFFVFSILVWIFSLYLSNMRTGNELILNRIVYFGSILIAAATILLGINFPNPSKLKWWQYTLILMPTAVISFLIFFTNIIIKGYVITSWGTDIDPGQYFFLHPIYFLAHALATISLLIYRFKNIHNIQERRGIKLFIIGLGISLALGYFFNSFAYYLVGSNVLSQYGPYTIVVFVIFASYAMFRHRLFNTKVILTEVAVIFIWLLLLVQTLLSNVSTNLIINITILILSIYGGILIIRSVNNEIRQREELEMLTKRLREANEHLKGLDKMKDDFLSMASHELNTPLAAIEGYLSMILDEGMGGGNELAPQTREYLDRIYKSSERLAEIVKGLLNVSRIESGRIHLIYEQSQIEEIIKESVAEIDPKVKERNHSVCIELPAEALSPTYLDKTRITEVVLNLLGNAVKYTDPGGHIEVGANQTGGNLRIWVKDDGRGIPKDKIDRVFQKFSQVDVLKDEVKGTGLGMYISQKFVELHKGKIWFESEGEGKGTTFFFELPILKERPYDPYEGEGSVLR